MKQYLMANQEYIWLDAVRRHKPITKDASKHLKERNLIEGYC